MNLRGQRMDPYGTVHLEPQSNEYRIEIGINNLLTHLQQENGLRISKNDKINWADDPLRTGSHHEGSCQLPVERSTRRQTRRLRWNSKRQNRMWKRLLQRVKHLKPQSESMTGNGNNLLNEVKYVRWQGEPSKVSESHLLGNNTEYRFRLERLKNN